MNFFNFKKIIMYLVIVLLLLLNISITIYFNISKKEDTIIEQVIEENIIEEEEIVEEIIEEYYVDIKGAVASPGVYKVSKGTIINDVITLAGGLNKNASTKYINLSALTTSSMVIYIYTTKELETKTNIVVSEPCICNEIKECIDNKESIIIESDTSITNEESTTTETTSKININTATKEELSTLNGIGEQKALSIIEYRTANGNFTSIEDIKNVSGIGDSAYEKIKDYITV